MWTKLRMAIQRDLTAEMPRQRTKDSSLLKTRIQMTKEPTTVRTPSKASIGHPPLPSTPKAQVSKSVTDPLSNPEPPGDSSTSAATGESSQEKTPCLIDRLFSCTIDLLFCAGFTVPQSVKGQTEDAGKINVGIVFASWLTLSMSSGRKVWARHSASAAQGNSTGIRSKCCVSEFKPHRLVDNPGFLVILLSTTIFTAPTNLHSRPNIPLEHLTHSVERRLVLSLLCSFLNTSLALPSSSSLPYTYLVSKAGEDKRTLIRASLMALLVALDYQAVDKESDAPEGKEENAFRFFISKLVRALNNSMVFVALGLNW